MLAQALGRDSDEQVWVHAVPRPVAVEAAGEDGLSRVKSEEMPCDEHHASVLRTAAQMMHRDMLAPVAESRDRLNDSLASEGKAAEGLSLSEVVSRVVANG